MNSTNINITNEYGSLGTKLVAAQKYVLERYEYYNDEQTNTSVQDANSTNSDAIKQTIDDLRNRLLVNHFINATSVERYFNKNFMNKIIKSALISGCAFARVIKKNDGTIDVIPYDAYYATGNLNNDNTLSEAITIDNTDDNGNPTVVTYYSEAKIITKDMLSRKTTTVINKAGIVPITPIIFNQNALKPFGSSFITKKMMKDTDSLKRDKQRLDLIAQTLTEANAFLLGVSKDIKDDLSPSEIDKLKSIIMISTDADQQSPKLETRDNGSSQLEQKIEKTETGIKYDIESDIYKNMVASIQQDLINSINLVGDVIIQVNNDSSTMKLDGEIDIVFKNVDYDKLSALMDGVLKVNQVVPNYWGKEQLDKILGVNGNKSPLLELPNTEAE